MVRSASDFLLRVRSAVEERVPSSIAKVQPSAGGEIWAFLIMRRYQSAEKQMKVRSIGDFVALPLSRAFRDVWLRDCSTGSRNACTDYGSRGSARTGPGPGAARRRA